MKIFAQNKMWSVPHPISTLGSPARFILGCERCASTCVTGDPCKCCRAYGTRSAGGQLVHFPDDGRGHRQLMPMREFRELAQDEIA